MAKSKLIDEVIQDNVQLSEDVLENVVEEPKDSYKVPKLKNKDVVNTDPGHSTRAFRSK